MAQFPRLPIFTDALLGDTQHLTAAEFGAYLLMLIIAWRTDGCCLPSDEKYLSRITRLGRNWQRHREVLLAFWGLGDDGKLRQKRLTKVHLQVADFASQASAAGKASALKRQETKSTDVEIPLNVRTNGTPTSNSNTNSKKKEREKEGDAYASEALEFWGVYSQVARLGDSKKASCRAYAKARSEGASQTNIMDGVKRFVARHKHERTERQYIPGAAKWLNGACWETEQGPPKQPIGTAVYNDPYSVTYNDPLSPIYVEFGAKKVA